MSSAVIFDLDGTLATITHRLHHVTNGGHDWDAFFRGIPDDDLCDPIAILLDSLYVGNIHKVLLVSGRPEKCRADTERWLHRHLVFYHQLYMRSDNDSRPDYIVKKQILNGILQDGYEPFITIDDRQSVVEMWRENDIVCLQCAPSDSVIPPTALLTLMVGPSGAGKTCWLYGDDAFRMGILRHQVISSDDVRAELCGDFLDQSKNEQVFAAVHAVAKARLKHGLPAVIDATHIRRRDRMASAALAEGKCQVRYIVIDRPIDIKRIDGGWRNDVINNDGVSLIDRHARTFQSQIKEILVGDNLPNVQVFDLRSCMCQGSKSGHDDGCPKSSKRSVA